MFPPVASHSWFCKSDWPVFEACLQLSSTMVMSARHSTCSSPPHPALTWVLGIGTQSLMSCMCSFVSGVNYPFRKEVVKFVLTKLLNFVLIHVTLEG